MLRNLIVVCVIFLQYCEHVSGLQLEKVLILSRHGIRAPLSESLEKLSPKAWPKWNIKAGHLTPKGALLEAYMGEYFSTWLHREGLIKTICPKDGFIHIYANNMHRTIETAKTFSGNAFQNCNITVHVKNISYPNLYYDPVFSNRITKAHLPLKHQVTREVKENLEKVNLGDVYEVLNNITDLRHSEICEKEGVCDLTKGDDDFLFDVGHFLFMSGRFKFASLMVDAFLMEYYDGFPLEDVAWGQVTSDSQWKQLLKMSKTEMNVCLNLTTINQFIEPLLNYIKFSLEDDRLFTLMVGHDLNIKALMFALGFDSYELPEQFEDVPIGSKLVFQKWTDGANAFLKVEFVYQSWFQIWNAERLSFSYPPKNITMRFKKYEGDKNGMYPWVYFENVLNHLL